MSTSQNFHLHPSSIQLPRLFPRPAYQVLSDPPETAESISQSPGSGNLQHNTNLQHNIVRHYVPNFEVARDAEAEFKRSFGRFYKKYCSNQTFTLMFFLILITGATPSAGLVIVLFIGFAVLYFSHLVSALYRAETLIDTFRLSYKMFEFIGVSVLVIFNPFGSNETAVTFIMSCLLFNYLLKSVLGYYANRAQFVRFTNQVNKTILGIRACIFVQGILMVVIPSRQIEISAYFGLIPYYAVILILIFFTGNFIRNVYFVHKDLFWRSAVSEKKTGLRWILGNLFSVIGLLFSQFLVIFYEDGEVLVFIATVTWCSISLLYSDYCRDGVFRVCEDLAIIIENKGRVQIEDATEDIKYVKRISNTYFKPISHVSSGAETTCEGDLEAGIEERLKCIVCCKEAADAVFMECGHGGICFSCGKTISEQQQKECHMCRQKIRSLLKLNMDNKENVYEVLDEVKSYEPRQISWYTAF